jgi:hypothetical protein
VLSAAPFNSEAFGMSSLDAQVLSTNSFIIGIADLRGDGCPDYTYHAHVLYGDSVSPSRAPVSGGAITLQGTGFAPRLAVSVGSKSVPLLVNNASQILVAAPAHGDGPQTITISDPVSGASSIMTAALTFGAAATDKILLLQGTNPPTPVGTQATNPVAVQVVASDGVTPMGGATVGWTTTNGATLSVCGGVSSCAAITDESGIASTRVTPAAAGVATITATRAGHLHPLTVGLRHTVSQIVGFGYRNRRALSPYRPGSYSQRANHGASSKHRNTAGWGGG